MSREDKFPSSPLYHAKNVLFALRWFCCGFPLKQKNDEHSQFMFNKLIEYGKYACFIFVNIAAVCWNAYAALKVTKLSNPLLAFEELHNNLGISDLDRKVLWVLPIVSFTSNHFYFLSFKNNIEGINSVLKYLCNMKEFLQFVAKKSTEPAQNMKKLKLYKYLLFLFCITLLTTGMMTSFWFTLVAGTYGEDLTNTDMILTFLALFFSNWAFIYPGMAVSADLLVCTLMEEVTKGFEKFSLLLEQKGISFPKREVHMRWANPKPNDVSMKEFSPGYDKCLF